MKKCKDCGKEKPLTEFSTRQNYTGTESIYYKSHCKDCLVKRSKAWQKKNPKKFREYQNKYAKIVHKKVRKNSKS